MPSVTLSSERRNKLIGAVMLLVYAVLTLIGATHHELWFDESQAWVIARDATLETFPEILKHEGHPGLWHLILMPFAKSGAYCETANIISWIISVVAAGLFVWKAPFGLVFKAAMLFSSGFLFYNSVNSRVYCLIPLLLFLIAIVYPKREKYAPVYGLLVGLLANTHVMMCGLVGILGIFMLIELFQSIRKKGVKKSTGQIAGIVIAGALVLAMILPLVGALAANSDIQNREYSAKTVFQNVTSIFINIGENLMIDQWDNVLGYLFSSTVGVLIIVYFIVLFNYRKAFITAVVFLVFYTFVTGVVWCNNPPRTINFMCALTAVFWIARQNEQPKAFRISYNGSGNKVLNKLTDFMIKAFTNPSKTLAVLLCAVLFLSLPSGLFWLFYDYGHEYTMTEKTAEFIMNELPEDSVVVLINQNSAEFDAYTNGTNIRFYSLEIQNFTTYNPHIYNNEIIDFNKIKRDLSDEKNIYLLYSVKIKPNTSILPNIEPIYTAETYSASIIYSRYVEIYGVKMDDIIEAAEYLQRTYED